MIVELIELLKERTITHPSEGVSSSLIDGELRVSIQGYPWWQAAPTRDEDRIVFLFSGVARNEIDLGKLRHDDEILEAFDIHLTSTLDWAQPDRFEIYCSGLLPDPVAIYTTVEDYLSNAGALRKPGDFLNGAGLLSTFLRITASPGYKLARCPLAIHDLLIPELRKQSVPHTVLDTVGRTESPLFVRWGSSAFFCETARAEFD